MPQPGKCWRHVIIGTHGTWLPGSPKGWRSRGHRIHSSGDYKNPPPTDEHAGLYAYQQSRSSKAVVISVSLRPIIGQALVEQLHHAKHRVLCLAIAATHCHLLAELPQDKALMNKAVGEAKRKSSRAVKAKLPGRVWAAGGKFIVIKDAAYQQRVFDYICRHREEDAWVWTYRDNREG